MNSVVVNIGGVEINLHFRFSTLYRLGRKWNLDTVNGVIERIVRVSSGASDGVISIEAMDVYSDIILLFAPKIDRETVIDHLFENNQVILDMITALMQVLEAPTNQEEKEESEESPGK